MSALPVAPWTDLSLDFKGPLPSGKYYLVLIDDFSRYPIVKLLSSTQFDQVIPILENIFALFGIPETIRTDNGAPF